MALIERLRGELDRIAAKALRKQPAQRQASVEQFARELRNLRNGSTEPAPLQRVMAGCRAHPRRLLGIGLLAVMLAIAFALPSRRTAIAPVMPVAPEDTPAARTMSESAASDQASRPEVLLAFARDQLQRGEDASVLDTLTQVETQLAAAGEPREQHLQLRSLRAIAATRGGDFPLATQALDQADSMTVNAAERADLALLRVRLLTARGREAQAAAVLREIATDTLPRLRADDPLAAQIRRQLGALDEGAAVAGTGGAAAAGTDTASPARVVVPQALRARLEALSRNIEAARAEAGIDLPAAAHRESLAIASAPASSGETSPAQVPHAPDDPPGTAARVLADHVARACALNVRGDYAAAQVLLASALELQRTEPGLRHSDDYRVGVLAAVIAHHGASPTADLAERLRHELTRDVWLSSADGRTRWREQAAIAQKLGVQRAD